MDILEQRAIDKDKFFNEITRLIEKHEVTCFADIPPKNQIYILMNYMALKENFFTKDLDCSDKLLTTSLVESAWMKVYRLSTLMLSGDYWAETELRVYLAATQRGIRVPLVREINGFIKEINRSNKRLDKVLRH